jgi:aspartate aminotransferase-like enzyme
MTATGTFFLPGPTEVRPAVLAAMTRPMIAHRGAEFEALFGRCLAGLQQVMRTARPVIVSTSSATGLMEAAMRCAPAGPVLCLANGAFSQRFAHIGAMCGRDVTVVEVPWGQVVQHDAVRVALRARRYAAMAFVHSETSTGARQDVAALAALAREQGAMSLVDSVSGVGGMPVEPDAWDVDFVLTGSQKALALPPGFAFGVMSERFAHAAKGAHGRGVYFDLVEAEAMAHKRQTPQTPAVSLLYALDAQLESILLEGMDARWARHRAMAELTHAWIAARAPQGLGILAPEGNRSDTVTVITLPAGVDGKAVVAGVARQGYVIGSGYGPLAPTSVRIGHMGDHTPDGVARCLMVLDEAMDQRSP